MTSMLVAKIRRQRAKQFWNEAMSVIEYCSVVKEFNLKCRCTCTSQYNESCPSDLYCCHETKSRIHKATTAVYGSVGSPQH